MSNDNREGMKPTDAVSAVKEMVKKHPGAAIGGGVGAALGATVGGPVGAGIGGAIGGFLGSLFDRTEVEGE